MTVNSVFSLNGSVGLQKNPLLIHEELLHGLYMTLIVGVIRMTFPGSKDAVVHKLCCVNTVVF